jgi:hypothetical protein
MQYRELAGELGQPAILDLQRLSITEDDPTGRRHGDHDGVTAVALGRHEGSRPER